MTDKERYERAQLCMQAGVKMDPAPSGENVHSRVGINTALTDHSALARVLIDRGVITEAEYFKALADAMEGEVRRYEAYLQGMSNVKITLVGRLGSIHDDEVAS